MTRSVNKKLITKRDGIIILVILFTALVCVAALNIFSKEGKTAAISIDGKMIKTVNLIESKEITEVITLKEVEGAVIEIKDGKIRVKSSDCPDKICVNTGYISKEGERIVCLPKKLIIEIKADN